MKETRQYYKNWMTNGRINHPDIANIEVHGWNIVHRTTLNMIADRNYNHVFDLIEKFAYQELDVDHNILSQLLKFQKTYVIDYDDMNKFPITLDFDYDFIGYIQDTAELETSARYKFDFVEDKNMSLERFLENIYFYRKRNFGKALITKE
jgi:hypothetical protein